MSSQNFSIVLFDQHSSYPDLITYFYLEEKNFMFKSEYRDVKMYSKSKSCFYKSAMNASGTRV